MTRKCGPLTHHLIGWSGYSIQCYAAVDLEGAMESDRFFYKEEPNILRGDQDENRHPRVIRKFEEGGYAAYEYIGMSPSGVHVVRSFSNGGGTGVFQSLLMIAFETQSFLINDGSEKRDAVLMKIIGSIPLGDRYEGSVSIVGNKIKVEKDNNDAPYAGAWDEDGIIEIP